MTADAVTLRALAERVETDDTPPGKAPPYEHDVVMSFLDARAAAALRGSLDACAALHEAVLGERWPGWCVGGYDAETWLAELDRGSVVEATGHAPTPARAWLAAILRARASEMEPRDD